MNNEENETTITLGKAGQQQTAVTSIEIFYNGDVYKISDENLPFIVGRDRDKCQLALENKLVSREHFVLTERDGLIGLEDTSTNGTWVQLGRSRPVQVKHAFIPLLGSGLIQAGCEIRNDENTQLHFKVLNAGSRS